MPRYRTTHHTDGPGIGKKLKGDDLEKRLADLTKEVLRHHQAADEKLRSWLDEARGAGDALLEVKRRLGHRMKWSHWRRDNLIGPGIMSKETTAIYMRIAREWDNPHVQKARESGKKIDSINGFLKIIRGGRPEDEKPITKYEFDDAFRWETCKRFKEKVKELTHGELRFLDEPGVFDSLWKHSYDWMKKRIKSEADFEECYDDEEAEKTKREIRRRCNRALNSNWRRRHLGQN